MDESTDTILGSAVHRKTISQLILELEAFENRRLYVEILQDSDPFHKSINLVGKKDSGCCILENLEGSYLNEKIPDFVSRGKTVAQLIAELRTFENQDLFVEVSLDSGRTYQPVTIVERKGDIIAIGSIVR